MEQKGAGSALGETGEGKVTRIGMPDDSMSGSTRRAPVPDFPSLSVRAPSSLP